MAAKSNIHSTLIFLIIVFQLSLCVRGEEFSARISMKGIRSTATFSAARDGSVNIKIQINRFPENGSYSFAIHDNPMIYDRDSPCDDFYVGPVLHDLSETHGTIKEGGLNVTDNNVMLFGAKSIMGRTLVFQNGSDSSSRVCASILPKSSVRTAQAIFTYPVSGVVTFRQIASDEQSATSIYVDLSVSANPLEMRNYTWHVSDNYELTPEMTLSQRCNATQAEAIFDPKSKGLSSCSNSDHTTCPVGALRHKFGFLQIEPLSNPKLYFFMDTNLPVSSTFSIIGKSLVLSEMEGSPVACSAIRILQPKTVTTVISSKNITGSVAFSQPSLWEPTEVSVDLVNLRGLVSGYHVHEYTVPPRYYKSDNIADSNSVSGHFNPYNIVNFPAAKEGTEDEYEIGDLSNKFGTLSGLEDLNATYVDWNLPLFGPNSIVGRSIVIHLEDGSRWAYGTIGYPDIVKTVMITFKAPVVGTIILKQSLEDPESDTSVFVVLANADGSAMTENHNWHVHVTPITDDYLASESRCVEVGGHYNPFSVDLDDGYEYCSPQNQRRCEVGDFAGKHGTISVASKLNTADGKFFFTDIQLPLSGVYSIDQRSVVIHNKDAGSGRLACEDLHGVAVEKLLTGPWTDSIVSGTILIEQVTAYDPAKISVDIDGLNNLAGGWHIHELPVYPDRDNKCSLTKGHYNPFDISGSPAYGTQDMYEMGDLSGKFGKFVGQTLSQVDYSDQTVALSGARSVSGRSIVIHRDNEAGSRWTCATLIPSFIDASSFSLVAESKIELDGIVGTIQFTQIRYGTGIVRDTTILVDLSSPDDDDDDNTRYDEIEWSILQSGDCLSTALYNPYKLTGSTPECSLATQSQCIVGDLSAKHGNYMLDDDGAVFTDTNLPLFGQASGLGLMLKLVARPGDEYSCFPISPMKDKAAEGFLAFPSSMTFKPYDFRKTISDVYGVDMWQVITMQETTMLDYANCQTVFFWIVDEPTWSSGALQMSLLDRDLSGYTPGPECEEILTSPAGPSLRSAPHIFVTLMSFVSVLLCLMH